MIAEKIKDLIAKQLNIPKDKVNNNSKIVEDLGADSLDTVEMLMTLEEEFGISIPDDEAVMLKTVGSIIELVENKTK